MTWWTTSGGTTTTSAPTTGDDADTNGKTVTVDQAVTCDNIVGTGTLAITGNRTVTANLGGAWMWSHITDEHKRLLADDPSYVEMFDKHPETWFIAQMLMLAPAIAFVCLLLVAKRFSDLPRFMCVVVTVMLAAFVVMFLGINLSLKQ